MSGAVLMVLVLTPLNATRAQGGAAVYVTQFHDLRQQLNSLATRAETIAASGKPSENARFGDDSLALEKLIHRLGEEASATNLGSERQGRARNKTLSLVSVGVEALSLEALALDELVETGDRAFKAAGHDADTIAANLAKSM
jgi:hypothetical protein